MIEDAIMDILDEPMQVYPLLYAVMTYFDITLDEAEDAVINLEEQGRVRGYSDGTAEWIEAVPLKEDARVASQEGSP